MGQYTLAQAEAALSSMAGLSDDQRRQFQAEVEEARAAAVRLGETESERIAEDVRSRRDDLLREACQVRDDFAAAQAEGDRARLADLRHRQDDIRRQVTEMEHMAEQVEAIEAEPGAYGERIFNKYPRTRPQFSF